MQDDSEQLTLRLLELTQGFVAEDLPEDVRELTRQCVLDWIGVALAGSNDHLISVLLGQAEAEGGKTTATVVGHRLRVSPIQAALINGTSSHVLDYDDVNLSMNGHPTAAILPALLALAETEQITGKRLVEAFVAGYELACRVGLLVGPGHYARGYHATCTVGTLGAAAACARLLCLDVERAAHAIGIAATQAGGLKSMFGTECKPFHAGVAAQNGLRAARLAEGGMMSRPDALECGQGFARTMSPDFNPASALADPGKFYLRENLFKYHASCFGTHAAIECVQQLRKSNEIPPPTVERVRVRVEKGLDAMCNIETPQTGLQAKFSLRFMAAAALAGEDTSDLALFHDEKVRDRTLGNLREKVSVEFVTGWPMMQAEVIVHTTNGSTLRAVHDAGIAGTDYSTQARRLANKFVRLVEPELGANRCGTVLHLLDSLEQTKLAELMAACVKQ